MRNRVNDNLTNDTNKRVYPKRNKQNESVEDLGAAIAQLQNTHIIEVVADKVSVEDVPQYIANLETYIARLKEIHWSCDNDKTHILCDDLVGKLKDYQDEIAEDYMGAIDSKFKIGFLDSACSCDTTTLPETLKALRSDTIEMYDVVCQERQYKGIERTLNKIMDLMNSYLYKETQK